MPTTTVPDVPADVLARASRLLAMRGPETAMAFLESFARHPNTITAEPTDTAARSGTEKQRRAIADANHELADQQPADAAITPKDFGVAP